MAIITATSMPSSGWNGFVGISGGIPTSYTQYCNVRTGVGLTAPVAWVSGNNYDAGRHYDGFGYVTDTDANWYLCILDAHPSTTHPSADPTHWSLVPKTAAGDGVTDDQPIIQYATASCPDNKYVYLPASSYRINSSIIRNGANFSDNVQRPYSIEIRGDGLGLTKILNYSGSQAINFFCSGFQARTMSIVSGNTRGSTSLVLSSFDQWLTSGIRAITVRRTISDVIASDGVPYEAAYMIDCASQVVQVTSLNAGTKTVTISPALNDAYTNDYVSINISEPYKCGITGIYFENMTNTETHMIFMEGASECWVKGCEVNKVCRHGIQFKSSFRCEATQNIVHDVFNTFGAGGGDHGYGIVPFQYASNCLVYNNIFYHLRHAMPLEWGGQANVFGYNYSFDPLNENQLSTDYLMGDALSHGGAMHYNLYEGNVMATIRRDSVLGSSRWTTNHRNQIQRKGLASTYVACFGSDIQKWNYNENLSGNCYEAPAVTSSSALRRWGTNQDNNDFYGITGATNASPIVLTLNNPSPVPFLFQTGDYWVVSGVAGNTAANGSWRITTIDDTHVGLQGSAGNGTYTSGGQFQDGIDPQSQSTANVDGDYDIVSNTTTWAGADHTLPDSYYLSSQPSWWDSGVWPSVGPDLSNKFGLNPAYRRYNAADLTPTLPGLPTSVGASFF